MGDSKTLGNVLWEERKEAVGEGVVRRIVIYKGMGFFTYEFFHLFILFECQPIQNSIVNACHVLSVQEIT